MEQKPDTSGNFSIFYGDEKPLPTAKKSTIEKLSIFRFLLEHIRSQTSGREGRVAKRKIDCSSLDLWQKYKNWSNGNKDAKDYRVSYRIHAQRLYELAEISNSDKLDLYYALDIKIPKIYRQKILDEFHVDINEEGVITGNVLLEHWDLVHPDSDREDENEDSKEKIRKTDEKWSRFTEKDDGMMWEFVLSQIQKNPNEQFMNGKKIWEEFKNEYKDKGASITRAAQTYSQRYHRILAPNLHLMPFDIETKAAIYENTKITVPEEFREQLISKTNVTIDEYGTVIQYPGKPQNLVLQSTPIEDLIGFTSPNRISTLIHPKNLDTNPWTSREDKQIWAYVLLKMRNERNKAIRAKNKLSGYMFWRKFVRDHKTERTWQALCQHFNEDLIDNIMETNFPISTKIQLLFICNTVLDEDDKRIIEPMCKKLVLNSKGGINYASGNGFRVGRPNFRADQSMSQEDSDEEQDSMDPEKIVENLSIFMRKSNGNEHEEHEFEGPPKKPRIAKKYATSNGNLTMDNIGDFMKKIKDNYQSEKREVGEKPYRTWSSYRMKRNGELNSSFESPTVKKRCRRTYDTEENEETQRKVENILKMFGNGKLENEEEEHVEENHQADYSNFAPLSLADLAENAKTLVENLNLAPNSNSNSIPNSNFQVKSEPLEDLMDYGVPPELRSKPTSILKVQKEDDNAASKSEIDYSFSRIENEIRSFTRTLRSGAPNLTEQEKKQYLERIEELSSLFHNHSMNSML